MRRLAKIAVSVFFLFPLVANAACSANGYTVVFVNGVFDTKAEAAEDSKTLQDHLGNSFNGQSITYTVGYNQTHVSGAGDLAEVAFPSLDQYDLDNILRQIHDQVQTRKLIIVGHSQGAVYANKIYDYLLNHGEPKEAIAVYAVATPDDHVSGGGSYINYQGDNVIYGPFASIAIHPLPWNVSKDDWFNSTTTGGKYEGHGFIDEYLASFSDQITSGIKSEMFALKPTYASTVGDCFSAPEETLSNKATSVAYFYTDNLADAMVTDYHLAAAAVGGIRDVLAAVGGMFSSKPIANTDPSKERAINDAGIALLNALNITSLTPQAEDELQGGSGKNLGGAAILALQPDKPKEPPGEVLGAETEALPAAPAAPLIPPPPPVAAPIPGGGASGGESAAAAAPPIAIADTPDTSSTTDATSTDSAPSTPALQAPTITLSGWRPALTTGQFCTSITRLVDVSWSAVPEASSYDFYYTRPDTGEVLLFGPTSATSWPAPVEIPTSGNTLAQRTVTIVAHDANGNAATTSVRLDQVLADQTQPQLLINSLSPVFGATGVSIGTTVSVPFDEPLAPSSVIQDNIYIYPFVPGVSTERVISNPTLDSSGSVVVLTPEQPLDYSTQYNLFISCAISDPYGNQLPASINFAASNANPAGQYFTTEDAPTPPAPPNDPGVDASTTAP